MKLGWMRDLAIRRQASRKLSPCAWSRSTRDCREGGEEVEVVCWKAEERKGKESAGPGGLDPWFGLVWKYWVWHMNRWEEDRMSI